MMGVAFSRVYLLYHSNVQVIAGLITGVTLGIIYFIITSVARDVGLVEWILNWPIIKYFMLKILIIIFIKHLLKNMKFIYNLEEKEMKHYCQLLLVMKKFNQYLKRYITWRIDKKKLNRIF